MKIYSIMLKIVAHYLYRITSFLIIYSVMHHADIPFHLGYNSYKLLRTDSTLFFNTRLFLRKSHCDLFSIASNTSFFLPNTWINQHVVSRFLSNRQKVFAKCRVRTISVDRTCLWQSFSSKFSKRKTVRIISCCNTQILKRSTKPCFYSVSHCFINSSTLVRS